MAPKTEFVKLSNGKSLPLLGLGTWQSRDDTNNVVELALDAGYRHIDTAFMYFNEQIVGRDIAKWLAKDKRNKREDIFVTTKLPMNCMASQHVERALKLSLERLGLDYVDLYLVHGPVGALNDGNDNNVVPMDKDGGILIDDSTDLIAIWKAMEATVPKGLAKSIGVSNYSIKQLKKTIANAKIPPAVHQFELHLRFQRPELVKFCQDNNIVVTSYSSLGSPGRAANSPFSSPNIPNILQDPVVSVIAANHKKSNAQVALKYWTQKKVMVIPKSSSIKRIQENADLFDWTLTHAEMAALKSLDLGAAGRSFLYTDDNKMRQHPEFQQD